MTANATMLDSGARRLVRVIEEIAAHPKAGDFGGLIDINQYALTQLRAALPDVQSLVISGNYLDFHDRVNGTVGRMLEASGDERYRDEWTAEALQEVEAFYLLGILVGAELAGLTGGER